MKKKLMVISLLALVFICSNCSKSRFASSDPLKVYTPRVSADKIKVYRTQIPKTPFIEIGTVHSSGSDDAAVLIRLLKIKAAKNGGDALIHLEAYSEGMSATAIRFK
ncbi:MAG: hypothetical protein GY757_53155 [bacterium]|nr:hypothetical protein [bacterium]